MSRLNIVDFIENFNSQLIQLTRFKILEFKRLFSLLCSTRFWGQPGEISLVVSCFFFCTHEQFRVSLKYSKNRTYSCHLTQAVYELGFGKLFISLPGFHLADDVGSSVSALPPLSWINKYVDKYKRESPYSRCCFVSIS